jgi:hypothetical protein
MAMIDGLLLDTLLYVADAAVIAGLLAAFLLLVDELRPDDPVYVLTPSDQNDDVTSNWVWVVDVQFQDTGNVETYIIRDDGQTSVNVQDAITEHLDVTVVSITKNRLYAAHTE